MVAITTSGFIDDNAGILFPSFFILLYIYFMWPSPSNASWLRDVVAEVKLCAVAEEDGLLTLPSGGLHQP